MATAKQYCTHPVERAWEPGDGPLPEAETCTHPECAHPVEVLPQTRPSMGIDTANTRRAVIDIKNLINVVEVLTSVEIERK